MDAKHYFTDNRDLPSRKREMKYFFLGTEYAFITDDGVFSKGEVDYGTHTLLKALSEESLTGSVLDLGCGYGVIGVVLKKSFPDITLTAVDVNPRAAELATENAAKNGTPFEVLVSDGFEGIAERTRQKSHLSHVRRRACASDGRRTVLCGNPQESGR